MPPPERVYARSPRLSVLVDGLEVSSAVDARVVSNNYYSSDWFEVSFSLSDAGAFGVEYWLTTPKPLIEISVATHTSTKPTPLIVGYGDTVSVDVLRGLVSVNGRDLSALLVDSTLHRTFPNPIAEEIVSLLALSHGLIPMVTPTAGPLGRHFAGTVSLSADAYYSRTSTDWDLIVSLAYHYGYDAFVQGRSLYFLPSGSPLAPTTLLSPGDISQIRIIKDYQRQDEKNINLISWDSQLQNNSSSVLDSSFQDPNPTFIAISEPNLSEHRLHVTASNILNQIRRQSIKLFLSMPGDTVLSARTLISLTKFGVPIDSTYAIECIDRTIGSQSGYQQRIRATRVLE